eukprot:2085445-Prymnesium_polylepis.1
MPSGAVTAGHLSVPQSGESSPISAFLYGSSPSGYGCTRTSTHGVFARAKRMRTCSPRFGASK